MKNNLVYGLIDPRNDIYCYIGKTTVGYNRPLKHIRHSHNVSVNKWVEELKLYHLEPVIDIIEENIELSNLTVRERYWINYYLDQNDELLNIQCPINNKFILNSSELDWSKVENMIEVLDNVPLLIKCIRIKNNLTQDDLAKFCGISRSGVSALENKNANIGLSTFKKIVNIGRNLDPIGKRKSILRVHRNIS
jgi:DNA-binding XRE family transcriptional regulator